MLGDSDVAVTIAVSDLETAKKFYGDTLGLKPVDENAGGVTYSSGSSSVFVYPSDTAGSNKSTYAAWRVKDIDAIVEGLKAKGVNFEQYDNIPGVTRDGDIHNMGDGFKVAWFKDPDGNILAMDNGAQ